MNREEAEAMERAVEVVRRALEQSLTQAPTPPPTDAEMVALFVAAGEKTIARGEVTRTLALRVTCSPVTEPLARLLFDAPIEFDPTMAPGAMTVVPFGYAEHIACEIGFERPPDRGTAP